MTSDGSVTQWIRLAKVGEDSATRALWERYFRRLVGLARMKLPGAARRVADEEDVALSVMDSFYRGLEAGRFPKLENRDCLWKVLVVLTARKSLRLLQRERCLTYGGGNVITEANFLIGEQECDLLNEIAGREPSPALATLVADEFSHLLDQLSDDKLRSIARWKMEEYTNAEIAVKLGCVERTVERKVRRIRDCWEKLA